MIVDRFRQTLIPLFRVKGVPVEIKEGLQSNINEELAKHQKYALAPLKIPAMTKKRQVRTG
jgi:hypothetical protein